MSSSRPKRWAGESALELSPAEQRDARARRELLEVAMRSSSAERGPIPAARAELVRYSFSPSSAELDGEVASLTYSRERGELLARLALWPSGEALEHAIGASSSPDADAKAIREHMGELGLAWREPILVGWAGLGSKLERARGTTGSIGSLLSGPARPLAELATLELARALAAAELEPWKPDGPEDDSARARRLNRELEKRRKTLAQSSRGARALARLERAELELWKPERAAALRRAKELAREHIAPALDAKRANALLEALEVYLEELERFEPAIAAEELAAELEQLDGRGRPTYAPRGWPARRAELDRARRDAAK